MSMIWTHNGQSGMSKQKSIALVRSGRLMGSNVIWSSMGNNLCKSFDIDIIEALTIIGKASHYSTHLDRSSVTNSERYQRTKTLVSLSNTCSSKKYFFILKEGFFDLRRELLCELTPVASKYLIFYQCRVVCCQVNFFSVTWKSERQGGVSADFTILAKFQAILNSTQKSSIGGTSFDQL